MADQRTSPDDCSDSWVWPARPSLLTSWNFFPASQGRTLPKTARPFPFLCMWDTQLGVNGNSALGIVVARTYSAVIGCFWWRQENCWLKLLWRTAARMSNGTDLFRSVFCSCSQKHAIHVHCYCNNCKGKAVNQRTQLNHIQLQEEMKMCTAENLDMMTDGDVEIIIKELLIVYWTVYLF